METFGEWLRGQRTARKLTHEEFAKRVGCSVSALRKIEYGERRPSTQIAELMANCLNVPIEERATFVRVARGELGVDRLLSASSTSVATKVSAPKTNLPVFPTPLIGRKHEVEQLCQLLRDPQCRLLTLVGPGGIGKTRLAVETAVQAQDSFTDGVYFVSLAAANSTRFIVPAIAASIGFAFHHDSHTDPETQLLGYLKEKQALLIIDNLEQLLTEPDIELLAELLKHAPQMKMLATSHGSMGFQVEWVFEVQGLPIPEGTYSEGTEQNTSVELFLQRARRANAGYSFTINDYPAILRICQLVNGMPLGIELAAAWVRTLSCEEIVHEIERGLDFLSLSVRDIPARHRSMRAVFDHSWKLLTPDEQQVLLRLSAFRGGFRRDAAEHVADTTLPVLSALVMKSLIRRSGAGRYDLHELIRQFAGEQLARRPEVDNMTHRCHGTYYLTHFGQMDRSLRSSAQRETLAMLTDELDNFRSAWAWAVTHGEFALIEQTMRTFIRLYDTRGWYQEGLDMLDSALNVLEIPHGAPPSERMDQVVFGHLLATRSWLAYRLANYEQAQHMLERSLEILRPINEPRLLVEAITYLGRVMEMTGHYARALELYSEGLEIATAIDNQWFKAMCFTLHTALVGLTLGTLEPEVTHQRLQSVAADWRTIGDPRLIAFALDFLSRSALRLERYDEARAALEENIILNSSVGFDWGLGIAYRGLGKIAQAQGNHREAVDMLHESLDIFRNLGASWFVSRVLTEMGVSFLTLGNETEAERAWREALYIATEIHGTPVALEALAGFASLQAKHGNNAHALELLLLILNHPASLQVTKNRATALQAELEIQLTPAEIETIQAHAKGKTYEQIVKHLLIQQSV